MVMPSKQYLETKHILIQGSQTVGVLQLLLLTKKEKEASKPKPPLEVVYKLDVEITNMVVDFVLESG